MATKTSSPGDIDELFKWVVRAMLILAVGVVLLGLGAFTGIAAANWFGYLLVAISFAVLIWVSRPVWS